MTPRLQHKLQLPLLLPLLLLTAASPNAHAESPKPSDRLTEIRSRMLDLEKDLLDSLKTQQTARSNLTKIKTLIKLQREERELGKQRLAELEKTITELESRKKTLNERITKHQLSMRKALQEIKRSLSEPARSPDLMDRERIEAPRRKVLSVMVDRSLKEIESYKIDLADAEHLEARIEEEKLHLAYVFHDLKEQESILELNRQLQMGVLQKQHAERVGQLETYRKLKTAENQVEKLIGQFNARIELEKVVETERVASKAMMQGEFASLRGKLPLPVGGKVVSEFGRVFDKKLNLHVFKKGVDIQAGKKQPVLAVSSGKVAYSGALADYGQITIIDHGGNFYTLCGRLGELKKKVGDQVAAGDAIGSTDDEGNPVYFEIRARNVAVNPLQWVSN